jgi:hypothetical protein
MLILFLIFGLMPVLVFIELTAQQWLFNKFTEKHDPELEIYQQRYD